MFEPTAGRLQLDINSLLVHIYIYIYIHTDSYVNSPFLVIFYFVGGRSRATELPCLLIKIISIVYLFVILHNQ